MKPMTIYNRRLMGMGDANPFMDLFYGRVKKVHNFYEPYSEGGENVFLRTTKSNTKWKTRMFYNKTISTTIAITTPYTGSEMGRNRDCYRDCPLLFSYNYGRVCGYRTNPTTWKLEYMEFVNMCTLEQENCKFSDRRPMWQVIHRGICPELANFKGSPTKLPDLKKRAKNWQADIEKRMSQKAVKKPKGK